MAERRFTLSEVVEGLQESDFEDSEDEFDGYLDMGGEEERDECMQERIDGEAVDVAGDSMGAGGNGVVDSMEVDGGNVGASVEVGGDDDNEGVPEYTEEAGCSVSVEGETPLDFFSLLFTEDMMQQIVTQTNLYAQQFIDSHELGPHSRVRQWSKETHDINELRRFLAIIILMGLIRYPQIESHWSSQWPYSNAHFSSVSYLCVREHSNCTQLK